MKPTTWALAVLFFFSFQVHAQQTDKSRVQRDPILDMIKKSPMKTEQGKDSRAVGKPSGEGSRSACRRLGELTALVDGAFDGQKDELQMVDSLAMEPDDVIWDEMVDCAESTKRPAQRAAALRAIAIWERLRAETFRKIRVDEQPIPAAACKGLDGLESRVKEVSGGGMAPVPVSDYAGVLEPLSKCANESRRLNQGKPQSEEARARLLMTAWDSWNKAVAYRVLAVDYDQLVAEDERLVNQYNALVRDYNGLLEHARKAFAANDAYIRSLEGVVMLQSLQRKPLNCSGNSYSYGKWGTFSVDCQ